MAFGGSALPVIVTLMHILLPSPPMWSSDRRAERARTSRVSVTSATMEERRLKDSAAKTQGTRYGAPPATHRAMAAVPKSLMRG